jgi:hypothetical protein
MLFIVLIVFGFNIDRSGLASRRRTSTRDEERNLFIPGFILVTYIYLIIL